MGPSTTGGAGQSWSIVAMAVKPIEVPMTVFIMAGKVEDGFDVFDKFVRLRVCVGTR